LQQRVLPAYRAAFFDALAAACDGGLSVFAGQPTPGEAIQTADHLVVTHYAQRATCTLAGLARRFTCAGSLACFTGSIPGSPML